MIRSVLVRALFVAIGAAAAALVISRQTPTEPLPDEHSGPRSSRVISGASRGIGNGTRFSAQADIERRLSRLEGAVAEAATGHRRLTEQVAAIRAHLAARGGGSSDEAARATTGAAAAAPEAANDALNAPGRDAGQSTMERALISAGLDPAAAADIKHRQDALAMQEIYLRDQATREQWLDSPRFAAELAAIDAQRTPLRAEIGDDAYDRYLFALGHANRVRVDEVLTQSPAEQAGLQAGDLILRYGDARLFAPGELVDQTRSGTVGETVQLDIIRNGQRLAVQVPRGPLGLRVAATQGTPDAS
jgi:hypothetical protein